MSAPASLGRKTRRLIASRNVLLATAVVFAAVPTYFAIPANAAGGIPANYVGKVVVDQAGVNDVVGQGDVTQLGRDDSDATWLKLFWSWDDATLNGANTLDACALLDLTGDGNVDHVVCASAIAGAGATVLQNGLTASTCDDAWTDRCGQPTALPFTSAEITAGALGTTTPPAASPPADLVTATDPFPGGTDAPNDTSIEVQIKKTFLPSAALINVCSYPSSGAGGINTDPKDCIYNPGNGAVQVTKTVAGAPPAGLNPFVIDLTCGGKTSQVTLTQATVGSTSSAVIPEPTGTSCSVNETAAHAQGATATYSGAATAANQTFTIAAGVTSSVTVTNTFTPPPGAVQVKKEVAGAPPAGLNAFKIDVTCGAGAATTYTFNQTTVGTSAAQPAAPGQSVPAGTSCTVSEQAATVQGAAVTYSGAQTTAGGHFTIVSGQTSTVTVTNTFAPIIIPPVQTPNLGITKASVPASGSTVKPGDTIVYTLSYSNTGNGAQTGVVLTDALPADLDYVTGTATAPGAYDSATRTLSWALGTLNAGASGTVSFTGKVASTATDGEVLHNVGVLTAPGISDPSNADDVTVSVPPTGSLSLVKDVSETSAQYGDTLQYTINATANQADQTNVVVNDLVPTGTTFVSASCASPCTASQAGGTVTWKVGTIAAGNTVPLTFTVTVDKATPAADGSVPAESIDNTAAGSSDQDPSVQSNKVTTTVVAVLGEKVVRKPTKKPNLPFTGLPFPLWQVLGVSLAMVMLGSALSFGMRPAPKHASNDKWRDQ